MFKSLENETEQNFVERFIADSMMINSYPEVVQRKAVAYSAWRANILSIQNSRDDADAKVYPFSFIEPGLVNYGEGKTVLVKKETLDRLAQSLVGKSVVNNDHRPTNGTDFSLGKAEGIVTKVVYNSETGWFDGEAMIWDPATKLNIKNGYSVSCAYDVTEWGPGGVHNNIEYSGEVLGGMMNHLAIVSNPRYEGAKIRVLNNSKGGHTMKLMFWKKDKQAELANGVEIDSEKATIEIGGKEVPLSKLVSLQNSLDDKAKADEAAKAALNNKLTDDDIVDLGGGKKATVKELRNSYLKNAEDEEKEKKAKEDEEKKNAADKEEKEKDEEHKNGKHENALPNCKMCNADKENALKNALENRHGDLSESDFRPGSGINSTGQALKRGMDRYGAISKK